jgi:hypothetical protein
MEAEIRELLEKESRNEKVDREKWSILERLDRVILSLLSFCLRTEELR